MSSFSDVLREGTGMRIKQRIALDLDGTSADIHTPVINAWNSERGGNFKVSDITVFLINGKVLGGMTGDDFFRIYRKIWINAPESIPTLLDSSVLLEASKHYEIDVVSSRSEQLRPGTHAWLNAKHPDFPGKVILVETSDEKASLKYDYYIDDYHGLAVPLAKATTKDHNPCLVLIERPWTVAEEAKKAHPNVILVKDVNEGLRHLIREAQRSPAKESNGPTRIKNN